jgi:hypothetical protein
MAKKDETKKMMDELYTLNYSIEQLNARIMVLSTRLGDTARYTEYIAGNLDFLISYTEHLAELYTANISQQNFGQTNLPPIRRAPTYDEYKEIRGVK